jgi:hypothetical protein
MNVGVNNATTYDNDGNILTIQRGTAARGSGCDID